MKTRFKVGDLVYCRYYKTQGIISLICEQRDLIRVRFSLPNLDGERIYDLQGKSWFGKLNKKYTLKKVKTFTPKQMLDFTNWCITNGTHKPNVDARDLVVWINEQANQ